MTATGIDLPTVSPELRGDGVLLTPWEEGDLPAIVELADDVGRWWSRSLADIYTVEDARRWLAARHGPGRINWAVRDPDTRAVVGRTSLGHFDEHLRMAEVGYGVHPAHRRRGVASGAVANVRRYAFGELGLSRLELIHDVENVGSCGVATRSGFALEGVERGALWYPDGRVSDQHRHGVLATDPPGRVELPPTPLDVPEIQADGLRLRQWRDADAAVYLRGLVDPDAARWYPLPPPTTEDDARRLIVQLHQGAREGRSIAWAAEVDGVVVGSVGLRELGVTDRVVNASYWVLPEARGHGVATRLLAAATTYAFEVMALHRVQLRHAVANPASCRVAEKAGFALEGTQRECCRLPEGFIDAHLHARLVGDQ